MPVPSLSRWKNDAVIIVGFSFRARAVTPRRFEGVVEFEGRSTLSQRRGTTAFSAPYDGFSQETNQSMAARRESPLTECPVSFCTHNTNLSFAPALAYASEALFAARITPTRGVSESESPLITIKGRGAMSGSMAGPSNSE